MEELEEEVNRAIEVFVASIMRAVERAAIAALRAAWAGSSQAGDARAITMEAELGAGRARRRETAPPAARTLRRAPTPTDTAALVGRIVACVGDVGLRAPELAGQQIRRWHLGPGIGGAQVLGEATCHAQPDRPLAALHVRRERRPPESQIGRHPVRAFSPREVHESTERPLGSAQLEAECPTNREVLVQRSPEATHRPTPGHGGATERNASRSTLA